MTPHADCPSAADLAAFSDGVLDATRREEVAEHLLVCETCYFILGESAAVLREVESAEVPRASVAPFRRRPVVLAMAAALALVLSIPLALRYVRSGQDALTTPLTAIEWETRPVDGRLSLFDYAAPPRRTRGDAGTVDLEVLAAAGKVGKETEGKNDATSLHAHAIADLAVGRANDAVGRLERAVAADATPALLSDLSAAYLARGQATGAASDFVEAYESAQKARAKAPTYAPAAFNAALALEAQRFLRKEAVEAWDEYLTVDATSPWAEEARRRRDALRALPEPQSSKERRKEIHEALLRDDPATVRRLAANAPQEARTHAEMTLFGDWAKATDEKERARIVRGLHAIGAALQTRGDPWIGTAAKALENASGAERERLRRGLLAMARAHKHYDAQRLDEARAEVDAAAGALEGTPFIPWVAILDGSVQFVRRDGALDLEVDPVSPSIAGRAEWLRGLSAAVQGRPFEARQEMLSSADRLAQIGENLEASSARLLAVQALEFLGDEEASWATRLRATEEVLEGGAHPERRHIALHTFAEAANRQEKHHFASRIGRSILTAAERESHPARAVDALNVLAFSYAALGRPDDAARMVDEATRHAASIPDERARERTKMFVDRTATQALRRSDPARAAAHARAAIETATKLDDRVRTNEVRTELAAILRGSGANGEAERTLRAVLQDTRSYREAVTDSALRLSFADTAATALDQLVDLLVSERRFDDAYRVVVEERGQSMREARVLLASASDGDARTLVYAVLSDKTVRWEGRDGVRNASVIPVSRRQLRAQTEAFRANLADDVLARSLYARLIGPAAPGERLVIVPDASLHALPFAALRNPRSGKRLIEEASIVIAATLHDQVRPSRRGASADGALVVGNPAIAAAYAAALSPLPAAGQEAQRIASHYRRVEVQEGEEATRERFLASAPHSRIVHFAGHGVTNGHDAGTSALFFAPSDDDGVLYARQLETLDLSAVDVLVLAACRTAEGRIFSLEGMTGIARAALVAGAANVVATLGDIEDAPSAHLFVALHALIAQGVPPEEAVRRVQTGMIASPDPRLNHPEAWGLVQVMRAGV